MREAAFTDRAAAATLGEIAVAVTAQPDDASGPALRWSLLRDVAAVAGAHGTEPVLREWWAKAATNCIDRRAAEEAEGCCALLGGYGNWPRRTEPVLRESWAKAANNYIAGRAAEEAEACRALLGEMRDLAEAHGTEAVLREWWARGCGAYTYQRSGAAPDECLAYVDGTAALAEMHWAEDQLFRWHAMGGVAWCLANGQARPADAERVWQRAMGLAQGREEIWAEVLRLFEIDR